MFRESDRTYWKGKKGGYRSFVRVTEQQYYCSHEWECNSPITDPVYYRCHFCKGETSIQNRAHCSSCKLTTCGLCSDHFCDLKIRREPAKPAVFNEKPLLTNKSKMADDQEGHVEIMTALSEISQKLDVLAQAVASRTGRSPSTSAPGTTSSDVNRILSDEDEEHETLVKCMDALNALEYASGEDYTRGFNLLCRNKEFRKMFLMVPEHRRYHIICDTNY